MGNMAGLLKAAQRHCPGEKGPSLRLLTLGKASGAPLSQPVLSSVLTAVAGSPTQAQMRPLPGLRDRPGSLSDDGLVLPQLTALCAQISCTSLWAVYEPRAPRNLMRSPEAKRGRGREEPAFNPLSLGNMTNSFLGNGIEPLGWEWEEESDPSSPWLPAWSPSSARPIWQHWQRQKEIWQVSPPLFAAHPIPPFLASSGCRLLFFIPQMGRTRATPWPVSLLVWVGPRKGAQGCGHFLAQLQPRPWPSRLWMGWWGSWSLSLHSLSLAGWAAPWEAAR